MGYDSMTRRGAAAAIGAAVVAARSGQVGATPATPQSSATLPDDFGVVFHVSSDGHWPYALSNLENLAASHPKARIRVVVDGTGVYALQGETDVVARLTHLNEAGVRLEVCPNALREHGVVVTAVPRFADTALGGVVSLVMAQQEGFAYIKP